MITLKEIEKMTSQEKYELGYLVGWLSQQEVLTIRAGIKAAWFDSQKNLPFDSDRSNKERAKMAK